MDTIFTRRSVRKFDDRPVEPEKLEQLLRAAMQAPSAGNQQPWEFLIVQEEAGRAKLSKMSPYAGPIAAAPLAIVLLGNEDRMKFPENWQQDMSAAAENLLLQAAELELGAVWLGVYPVEERGSNIREQFLLPDNLTPFAVIAVGYPRDAEANHRIDRYDESRVHYEKIG